MTNEDIIGIFVVSLLVGSLLADLVFGATWHKAYFTSGLTIFVKRIPVKHWHTNIPSQAQLEKKFRSDVISSLIFKEIDVHSYGFREKMFEFKLMRTPGPMHGLLMFDTNTSQVVVKGFVNWFILAFSLVWLGLPISGAVLILLNNEPLPSPLIPLGIIGGFILAMGIMYLFQSSRFSNVASFAAQSWARKHMQDGDEA